MSGGQPAEGRLNAERIRLGFGALFANPGDHIGHFYRTKKEWKDLILPFLRVGVETQDKCVCLLSPGASREEILSGLEASGIDAQAAVSSGQLVFSEGFATTSELRNLLNESVREIPERFRFLRWVGDMTWSQGKLSTSEALMDWECACNTLENVPVVFLCQYQLSEFSGSVVIDALRTHPLCIMGSSIHQNPYYEDPETFLDQLRNRASTPLVPK